MSDKPTKVKKERTEAQKKATASMLSKLKENREKGVSKSGRKKKEVQNIVSVDIPESESEEEVEEPKVVVKEVIKEVPVEPKYLTRDDLHAFKNELASMINPPSPPVQEKSVIKKTKRVKEFVPDETTEAPYKPIPKIQKEQTSLTGYSLLDRLLNR